METNLRAIRKEKRISINECVQRTGIPKQTILRYENGGTTIGMEHLLILSDFYGVLLDDFFDKSNKKPQGEMGL